MITVIIAIIILSLSSSKRLHASIGQVYPRFAVTVFKKRFIY